jgi:hypothetical protein
MLDEMLVCATFFVFVKEISAEYSPVLLATTILVH